MSTPEQLLQALKSERNTFAAGDVMDRAYKEIVKLRTTVQDTIDALERNSTAAPVVECLRAALH
jgi:hypothetical protein